MNMAANKIRILVGMNRDTRPDFLVSLEAHYPRFEIVGIASTGERLLRMACTCAPDVIVIRHPLNGMDTLKFLQELRAKAISAVVLVVTDVNTDPLKNIFARYGVSAFLPLTVTMDEFVGVAERAVKDAWVRLDPWTLITGMTRAMGFPEILKGTRYLKECVRLCLIDEERLYSMNALYQEVADRMEATVAQVERCIRNAVTVAWRATGAEVFFYVLSRHPDEATREEVLAFRHPTNQHIIAMMLARIHHDFPPADILDLTRWTVTDKPDKPDEQDEPHEPDDPEEPETGYRD